MKLISMTDFVLSLRDEPLRKGFHNHVGDAFSFAVRAVKYAEFLKQTLTLGMFVPIDDQGNVLKEPEMYRWYKETGHLLKHFNEHERMICEQYEKAKEKVLFKGFEVLKDVVFAGEKEKNVDYAIFIPTMNRLTIEEIIKSREVSKRIPPLELTESAIKQFM